MESSALDRLLDAYTPAQRRELFDRLRREFAIHPLERQLNTDAELILEAIHRSEGLILRLIRGMIAEAAFAEKVLPSLRGWRDATPPGDLPYDFKLDDGVGEVSIQVKLQRSKEGRPMLASEAYRKLPAEMYVVETQRTRGGEKGGQKTRPYRYGEFDVLAVSVYPSTGQWDRFRYTVASWLLPETWLHPKRGDPRHLLKFQPMPKSPDGCWTDDFATCVRWLRSGAMRQISAT